MTTVQLPPQAVTHPGISAGHAAVAVVAEPNVLVPNVQRDVLAELSLVIESRLPLRGGDPEASYVARLLHQGPDAFLKKIGEEATEVVLAAKDADHGASTARVTSEVADLWFHCMVALAHYGLKPADVIAELAGRAGTSGIEEKALRKAVSRAAQDAEQSGGA